MTEDAQMDALWAEMTPEERVRQETIARELSEDRERERLQREENAEALPPDAQPKK